MTDQLDIGAIRVQMDALAGFTEGPWGAFIDDSGGQWSSWPLSINAPEQVDKTIVRPGGHWPYEWDAETSQNEACRNAYLIAAAPDMHATILALCDALDDARQCVSHANLHADCAIADMTALRAENARLKAGKERLVEAAKNASRAWFADDLNTGRMMTALDKALAAMETDQ